MKKNIISAIVSFFFLIIIISAIIIVVVMIKVQLNKIMSPESERVTVKMGADSDGDGLIDSESPDYMSDNSESVKNADSAADNSDHGRADIDLENAVYYDGDLELPVSGATGYASVGVNMTDSANDYSTVLKVLNEGTAFLILREEGDWWEIKVKDDASGWISGWVRHAVCLINLPDVIPSIIYDNTNSYKSLFLTSGQAIPNISYEQLYMNDVSPNGKVYNERLNKEEFIMPVLYSMSKKIWQAQKYALENGDSLMIYEAFRPYSVQLKVANEVISLAYSFPEINKGLNSSPWSIDWFIATGVSNHQRGYAIDTSLVKKLIISEAVSGIYKYNQITTYIVYDMPTQIHELSRDSIVFTSPVTIMSNTAWRNARLSPSMEANEYAQSLQKYCTDAGLTPLASEWWHFNDLAAASALKKYTNGNYILSDCYSVAP